MAGDAAFPSLTHMTLFFSLLLALHFVMAVPESTFSPLTSTKDDAKKRNNNNMVVTSTSTKEESVTQNLKTNITPKQTTEGIHVPDLPKGHKGRSSQAQWQNKIFNSSEHEVPSGPNPISNR